MAKVTPDFARHLGLPAIKIMQRPTQPAISQSRRLQCPPHDVNIPSLVNLGTEVLGIVMEIIRRESPRTLSSVALVNSHFYHIARYSQFHELTLNLAKPTDNSQIPYLNAWVQYMDKANLLQAVRTLTILGRTADPDDWPQLGALIDTLISSLTGLSEIHWHHTAPIPDTIVQNLRERPSVHLNVLLHSSQSSRAHQEPLGCALLRALEGCPNLQSLEVIHMFSTAETCLWVTRPLKRILMSCPNIRRLKLDIGMPTGGCVVRSPPNEYCGLGFRNGERPLAALEELDLVRYPFGAPKPAYCKGYPLQVPEHDYWVEAFDWSRLKVLRFFGNAALALDLLPRLTSLREVALTGDLESLRTFYRQVPAGLETMAIRKLEDVELDSILKHGPSLRTLKIHQDEMWSMDKPTMWADCAMNIQALRAIREACPLLEDLSLDLPREETWPYELLEILASFPRLRRLEIWFELGILDQGNPIRPYTTFHASQDIYRFLAERSPTKPSRLTELRIHSGAPPPLGFGRPSPRGLWPGRNRAEFVCKLSERDDETAEGIFSTICTQLNDSDNQFLQKTKPGLDAKELKSQYMHFRGNHATISGWHEFEVFLAYVGPKPLPERK
ncbi:hypothetical protein M406DRAFT_351487 [Cryphonectria parasitica EP155]|uniref:F-box domain-containing protein n=1 Tax=Cryphonectria parasitica (strain ATCC 38755 / EP155) TaxID=660469 RepID=A0A9P5CQG9_CRYP1|nr:uncharacterized protein M406DRAFT_351487 [Cryphonectria parasitica EP155]KAF3766427.1 hypothetical protein M406DRAFT_351487 [Cryphonectria parasitica EP155]